VEMHPAASVSAKARAVVSVFAGIGLIAFQRSGGSRGDNPRMLGMHCVETPVLDGEPSVRPVNKRLIAGEGIASVGPGRVA